MIQIQKLFFITHTRQLKYLVFGETFSKEKPASVNICHNFQVSKRCLAVEELIKIYYLITCNKMIGLKKVTTHNQWLSC
jgi:hypothetical protein